MACRVNKPPPPRVFVTLVWWGSGGGQRSPPGVGKNASSNSWGETLKPASLKDLGAKVTLPLTHSMRRPSTLIRWTLANLNVHFHKF